MASLSIRDLGKSFHQTPVLTGISLDVRAGGLLAILGRSGSGKTTLLRLICGFDRPDAGDIAVDGRPVVHIPPERRRIGYVAQEGALFPHLRVADNIAFGLPWTARRARAGVPELLELVGLPAHYAGRWPQQLSGGEQQRVALARALAPKPRLVLLDEPFSSLDATLRADTRDAVAAALRAAGATAIIVTHDQSEALSMGDEVAVLRDGHLVQVAPPETLYRRPVDAALAAFVGDAVLVPGSVRLGAVACRFGTLTSLVDFPDGPATVMIRPEQIRLLAAHTVPAGQTAIVREVAFYGPDAAVTLRAADGTELRARVWGHHAPRPGTELGLSIEGAVMLFPHNTIETGPPPVVSETYSQLLPASQPLPVRSVR